MRRPVDQAAVAIEQQGLELLHDDPVIPPHPPAYTRLEEIAAPTLVVAPDGVVEAMVLGRHSEQCDLVVAHGSLSRRHARLRLSDGRLTIEDLGSTNGTIVDGMRLPPETPRPLRDGAQVLLGEIRFVVSESAGDTI